MADPEEKSKDSSLKTILTLLAVWVTALMPITVYINGCHSLAVEKEKISAQRGLDYLDRVLDTKRDPAYREGALDLLIRTTKSDDPIIYQWAVEQKKGLETIQSLKPVLEAVTASQAASQKAAASLAKKREGAAHQGSSGPSVQGPDPQERLLQKKVHDLNKQRLDILSTVSAAERQVVIKPDPQVDKVIADFRTLPGVDEFISKCAQDSGEFHYRFNAGIVQQLDCQFPNGSGQLPRIFAGPLGPGEAGRNP